jgi:D-threo-aldose 1-dehydrogenase
MIFINKFSGTGNMRVKLPSLGLGAAAIGNLYRPVAEADALDTVAAALESGIAYIDTAPHYGFGLSERRVGAALRLLDPEGKVVISTKVGRLLRPIARGAAIRHGFAEAAPFEPVFDYGYDAVMRSFEESRFRLGRRRVDVLLAHDLGRATHGADHERHYRTFFEGGYRAMRELREAGEVGAIGLGVNEWQICEEAMRDGEFDLFLLAGRYTLLEQSALDSFLPACAGRNIGIVIGGPYNSGILAEGTKGPGPHHFNYEPAPEAVIERVRRIEAVCEAFSVPLAAAALHFPLAHPQVVSVIPGVAGRAQVAATIRLANTEIPAAFWAALRAENLLHPDAPTPKGRP